MRRNRPTQEISSGSMADIAFLLLIFFLVTTTIAADKGIAVLLPPKKEQQDEVKLKQRNIFNILINSNDLLLIENKPAELKEVNELVKEFVTNRGKNPKLSESPQKAVVSLKTDRGTGYEIYVQVQDEIKKAYHELRAEFLKISLTAYNSLDRKKPSEKEMITNARKEYPYQVSDAEPTDVAKF